MTPPTVVEEDDGVILVRKRAGERRTGSRSRRRVLSDFEHELGEDAGLEKDGVERHLQEALAERPRRSAGPPPRAPGVAHRHRPGRPDVPRRGGGWVAVEIKRVGTIDAVEQLTRYLEASGATRRSRTAAGSSPPDDQAAGADPAARRGTRLCRGRSRRPAWRARAGADAFRGLSRPTCPPVDTGSIDAYASRR